RGPLPPEARGRSRWFLVWRQPSDGSSSNTLARISIHARRQECSAQALHASKATGEVLTVLVKAEAMAVVHPGAEKEVLALPFIGCGRLAIDVDRAARLRTIGLAVPWTACL